MTNRTLFIAEAGVNHNGSLDLALQLVDAAADAGADIVKFQTFKAQHLVTVQARKARYQATNTGDDSGQIEMLCKLELGPAEHRLILERCIQRGIRFMSTAFDSESLDFLATLDMPAVKIPSGDITHAPMLMQAARVGLPLIVSSGMCTLSDIEAALGVIAFALTRDGSPDSCDELEDARNSPEGQAALLQRVTLMHCVTEYPAPVGSVNLRAMDTMMQAFGLPVGYSDHTVGTAVSLAAVARGATVIEKHFTLDRALPGPDHAASLEPGELRALVADIRIVEEALGSSRKAPAAVEIGNREVARRSIVAARSIAEGEVLTMDALAFKRPGTGLSPTDVWDLLGRPAGRDYQPDELIEW
jgi:N-acetylneuraminate synthase